MMKFVIFDADSAVGFALFDMTISENSSIKSSTSSYNSPIAICLAWFLAAQCNNFNWDWNSDNSNHISKIVFVSIMIPFLCWLGYYLSFELTKNVNHNFSTKPQQLYYYCFLDWNIVRYFLVNLWNNVLRFNSLWGEKVNLKPQSYNTWRTTHLYWVMKFPNYFIIIIIIIIINWWYSSLFVLYFYNIKSHFKYCKFTKPLQNFTTLMINWYYTKQ